MTAGDRVFTADIYSLPESAAHEWPHTRASRLAWERHGPTPTFEALIAERGRPVLLEVGAA